MRSVIGVVLPDDTLSLHWMARGMTGASDDYGHALVDQDTYDRIVAAGERTVTHYAGRRLPGTNGGGAGYRITDPDHVLKEVLPDWYRGEGDHVAVYPAGHPLALTPSEIDQALASCAEWTPPGGYHTTAVAGITDPDFHARIWELARCANLLRWDRPLSAIQTIQALHYPDGADLAAHTDDPTSIETADDSEKALVEDDPAVKAMTGRTVSVIGQFSDGDSYQDGTVEFDTPAGTVVLPRERGSCAVFTADTWHHVEPVTGDRFSFTAFLVG